jgi:hypothetical protein
MLPAYVQHSGCELLAKTYKCVMLPADVQHGGCELLANAKDIKEEEAARARVLAQLSHKLKEELWMLRGSVDSVKTQVGGLQKEYHLICYILGYDLLCGSH